MKQLNKFTSRFLPTLGRVFILTLAFALCTACVKSTPVVNKNPEDAHLAWQNFTAKTKATNGKAFRISTSIRYATEKEKTRVTGLFWGNGQLELPSAIRLDLVAGFGNVVAMIREDADILVAFNPKTEVAYFHENGNNTLESFGVPVPLSLSDLALVLTGQSGKLFLPLDSEGSPPMPKNYTHTETGTKFEISNSALDGFLELSPQGVPLMWKDSKKKGWVIKFTPMNESGLIPKQLYIYNASLKEQDYSATITVKEINSLDLDYTDAQLELILPKTTVFHRLNSK